jgi:hypothetical protein
MLKGPIPSDFPERRPWIRQFSGSRTRTTVGATTRSSDRTSGTTHHELDFDALRGASTRITIGAGAESEGELANRAAYAVAERLGTQAVVFPSHHGGFVGSESGWKGEPEAFAVTLREVLAER